MALRVKISARAADQVRKAAHWWAENRPGAPGAIAADFAESVALLAEQPGIGAKYAGTRTSGVRRLFLNRVGYFIYYNDYNADGGSLQVLAFWHASREHQPVL
jgi:plasmid stabilization system protein ParE